MSSLPLSTEQPLEEPNSLLHSRFSRRGFLRAGVRLGIGAGALSLSTYGYASQIEPDWVEVTQHEVKLPHLPAEFDGFRVAQISDIHIEGGEMRHHFSAICDMVSAQGADAIVITGDFFTVYTPGMLEPLVAGLSRLKAKEGVYGVLGNHDFYIIVGGQQLAKVAMKESGIRDLTNTIHVFERDGKRLHLAGVDDFWMGNADPEGVAARIPAGEASILLGHEPDFALYMAKLGRFGLFLAGHSHGGQVCLPTGRPLHLPPYSRIFPRGLYQTGDMFHYTNRGLGTVGFALRLFSRPEISVFTLRA